VAGVGSAATRASIGRNASNDGGPLRYRIAHVAKLWRAGERPQLVREVIEGDPGLG